jgi:hypothetical protein
VMHGYRVQIVGLDGTVRNWDGIFAMDGALLEMDEILADPWGCLTYKVDAEVQIYDAGKREVVAIQPVRW